MEFINGWFILIIVSDVLTITGSLLKIIIQLQVTNIPTQLTEQHHNKETCFGVSKVLF